MINVSPNVNVSEVNNTYGVGAHHTDISVFVGHFERGPIDTPIWVTNVNDFKFLFGRGVNDHFNDWYQVYNFLQYGTGLYVVRSCGVVRTNASNISNVTIDNYTDWETKKSSISSAPYTYIARTPGTWGNLLSVSLISLTEYLNDVDMGFGYSAKSVFPFFEQDFFGVCVYRDGVLVESFYKSIYLVDQINIDSKYIYFKSNGAIVGSVATSLMDLSYQLGIFNLGSVTIPSTTSYSLGLLRDPSIVTLDLVSIVTALYDGYVAYGSTIHHLSGGSNDVPTNNDIITSYDLFSNIDEYDVDVVIGNSRYNLAAENLASTRKDCVSYIALPETYFDVNNVPTKHMDMSAEKVLNINEYNNLNSFISNHIESEYCHYTSNIKVQLDMFTNSYRLVNLAGDIGGLKTLASTISAWTIAVGNERGVIRGGNPGFIRFSNTQRDSLYKLGSNFIEGGTIASQRTFIHRKNKISQVNVRVLMNNIERILGKIVRSGVHNFNTLSEREHLASLIRQHLVFIKSHNGIYDGRISVYPNNQSVHIDITIHPFNTIDKIVLNMISSNNNLLVV